MSTTWSSPRAVGDAWSTFVSSVMVKTKTRSKKSSSEVTRLVSGGAALTVTASR
jgi:hypothetical protein